MKTQRLPIDPCHKCEHEARMKQRKCTPAFDFDKDNEILVPTCLVVEEPPHDLVVRDDFDDRNLPKRTRDDLTKRDVPIDPDEFKKKRLVTILDSKKFVAVWDEHGQLIPKSAVVENGKIKLQDTLW